MRSRLKLGTEVARLLLTAALAGGAGTAWAWGDEGHQIIGFIAGHYLTPSTKQKVLAMLAADPDSLTAHTIADETTWADKYRDSDRNTTKVHYNQTHNWHFVDIELLSPNVDTACFGHPVVPPATVASLGPPEDCVVDKIEQFVAELAAPGTSSEERLVALKFLLHFVGDVHQPLHASDDHDAGGNQKNVSAQGFAAGNLHHFWDTTFVQHLGADPSTVADTLIAKITNAQLKQWKKGKPVDWARESFQTAKVHAYGKLPAPNAQGSYRLAPAYIADATKTTGLQLSKAGVRLASILNDLLAS
jgi:hypothetical protein